MKKGLVELIETELRTFRNEAPIGEQLAFRELAVSLVRVFRDFVEAEIKQPDPYDRKEQGWE